LGWGSNEEAPDVCFLRRFLVLIFLALSTLLLPRNKALRQTDAERRLWMRLRRHQLGVQFRRQHPIGPYIVDFCCVERMMVVELDGGQHEDQRALDEARTQWLAEQGFRLLRFSDREALMETETVLAEIQNRL
jgi:very-short-patch-repair endonuclease